MEGKKTGLYNRHIALGAKMVPFAGYIMPVQYSSIIEEHMAVRKSVGVFDVSHMGEFELRGSDATRFLNRMTTNNVARLDIGQVHYSAMLYDDGGVVDDLLVYRFEDRYMLVVNAANLDKDYQWLEEHLKGDVELKNISDNVTLIAVQGPKAYDLIAEIADAPVDDVTYYHYKEGTINGVHTIISRTGYTGEDGFELYTDRRFSDQIWDAVFESGEQHRIRPAGLGARDSLRLEVCFRLYGNDIDQSTNPIEAGLGWIVKSKKKGGFIGKEAVLKAKAEPKRQLVGFELKGKGIARQHSAVFVGDQQVGEVTSGGYSPVLDKVVGLAYIDMLHKEIGTAIEIDVRGRRIPAEVVKTPFYSR